MSVYVQTVFLFVLPNCSINALISLAVLVAGQNTSQLIEEIIRPIVKSCSCSLDIIPMLLLILFPVALHLADPTADGPCCHLTGIRLPAFAGGEKCEIRNVHEVPDGQLKRGSLMPGVMKAVVGLYERDPLRTAAAHDGVRRP